MGTTRENPTNVENGGPHKKQKMIQFFQLNEELDLFDANAVDGNASNTVKQSAKNQ